MKQKIATIMLMFACVILLFHAVVPHHHHAGLPICFEQHHHDSDSHHNHGSCDDACIISEFFSPSDIQHSDVQFDECQFLNIYFCDCLESENLIFGLEGTQFRERPYLFIINETNVTRLGVLRGPPFLTEV